ncbi:hypothetical protein OS493_007644 [Desmophyllum pertusum]|uniref:Uncharacterized protein n=1 Tax=Desmophyllum pertusum TaxID=174260 RepID=A0A9X0CLI0_9CNID|nr:hypothetical protein OS493_007644 [Desmophyllum pertusum]
MVGGEEGVMYQTIAGQSVDFMLVIKDDKECRLTEGGYEVRVQVIQSDQQILIPSIQDHGDGLYSFSCAGVAGNSTLKVEVEGQNRTEFQKEQGRSGRATFMILSSKMLSGRAGIRGNFSLFLSILNQKSSFDGLEIGAVSHVYDERGRKQLGVKWCWYYHPSQSQTCERSDGHQPSITSVQDHDVFTVFLNLETKKLIIYNVRSMQAELFTGVDGDHVLPMISPRCTSSLTLDVQ